jgi:hypothetical protein
MTNRHGYRPKTLTEGERSPSADAPKAEACYGRRMTREDLMRPLSLLEPELSSLGVSALYLYGSFARDEARPDSDIDILVDVDRGSAPGLRGYLRPYDVLVAAFPGREIGYGTWENIHPAYRESVRTSVLPVF